MNCYVTLNYFSLTRFLLFSWNFLWDSYRRQYLYSLMRKPRQITSYLSIFWSQHILPPAPLDTNSELSSIFKNNTMLNLVGPFLITHVGSASRYLDTFLFLTAHRKKEQYAEYLRDLWRHLIQIFRKWILVFEKMKENICYIIAFLFYLLLNALPVSYWLGSSCHFPLHL